jgi:alpha-tubulin suppressor-like RCC1 family protein
MGMGDACGEGVMKVLHGPPRGLPYVPRAGIIQIVYEAAQPAASSTLKPTDMTRRPIFRYLVSLVGAVALIGCADNGPTQDPVVLKPTQINGGKTFVSLSLGDYHSCGLLADGEAFCWGINTQGQSGNGVPGGAGVNTPYPVNGGYRFASISAGGSHTCGILLTGETYCWGNNTGGQLGDGTTLSRGEPSPVSGTHTFIQVSASTFGHTCGLEAAGAVWCWGDNRYGQIGDGTIGGQRNSPTLVSGGVTFISISAGGGHTCGIAADSSAYCWGLNTDGQLGDGTTDTHLVPTRVAWSGSLKEIVTGLVHTCALQDNGDPLCWGNNQVGSLGSEIEDVEVPHKTVPTGLENGPNFEHLVSGERHTCGIDASGVVLCWGYNYEGELGDGTRQTRSTPGPLFTSISFKSIAAGAYFTCGISLSDQTYCWGDNYAFQLGVPDPQ